MLQKIANADVKKYPLLFISDNDGNYNWSKDYFQANRSNSKWFCKEQM